MDRWVGKIAVVTGAGAGMGAAIASALTSAGCRVVGLEKSGIMSLQARGIPFARQCDISNPEEVAAAFEWIDQSCGGVDILVNNAGVLYDGQITELGPDVLSTEQILSSINTNFTGAVLCTRHAIASMKRHGIDGHIVNITSIAGHYIPFTSTMNIYGSTKHALAAFTNSLLNEIAHFDNKIRVTSISPGLTATNLFKEEHGEMPCLQPEDIADAVLYVLSTPPHVNISELTIQPVMEKRL